MPQKARHWNRFGVDHPYDRNVRDVVSARTTNKSAILAKLCWDVMKLALAAGEPWALKTIEPIFLDVLGRDCTAEARYQDGTSRVYISAMDESRNLVLNVGIQPYNDDGTRANYTQRNLFIDLARAEWLALLFRQQSISHTEGGKLAGMLEYEEVWQKYPTAQSAREACAMAGIDPYEILPPDQQSV
jgi:hypothetical protein